MDGMSPLDFAFFAFVIIISYAVRGSAGFGGVTVPLLVWVMSLKVVVPMVTFLGLISSAAILRKNLQHVQWPALWRVMPFCLIGVAVGLYFFKTLDARSLARALGVFVTAYGLHALWMTWCPARGSADVAGHASRRQSCRLCRNDFRIHGRDVFRHLSRSAETG